MTAASFILPPGRFRLLLALLVVASHASRFQTGRGAVILFFMLSGYWVSDLWVRRQRGADVGRFFLNRALRIWPLYLLVAVATALWFGDSLGLTSITLLGVASTTVRHGIGVEWSLDIELQFYLLLPLVHILADRLRPATGIALALAVTIAGWAAWLAFGVMTAFQYMPAFLAGVAAFRLGSRVGVRGAALSLAAFVLVTGLIAAIPILRWGLLKVGPDPIDQDIVAMLWVAPLVPYVVASIRRPSGPRDRALGDLSYPLYLVHAPVLVAMAGVPGGKAVQLAGAILVSALVYRLIDRPFETVRRRLFDRRPAVPAPARD